MVTCAEGPLDPVFFSLDQWSRRKFRRFGGVYLSGLLHTRKRGVPGCNTGAACSFV